MAILKRCTNCGTDYEKHGNTIVRPHEAAVRLATWLAENQTVECQVCGGRVCPESCELRIYRETMGLED